MSYFYCHFKLKRKVGLICIISKIVKEANFISPNPTKSLTTSFFLFLLPFLSSDLSLTTLEFKLFVSEVELKVNTRYF